MPKLILLRHLESQLNKEDRFTGWTNVPLSQEGKESAKKVAEGLIGLPIDKVYTSPLTRNRKTVFLVLENIGKRELPVVFDKALDERNYGRLQGLNKEEVKKQYGQEQVRLWRRSWDEAPPDGESLKDVYNRVVPFYEENIKKDLQEGKNILVVASHNSLRALVKYLEKIPDEKVIDLEIATGGSRQYDIKD